MTIKLLFAASSLITQHVGLDKADIIIISSKCYLFSPWYSCIENNADFALNNYHPLYIKNESRPRNVEHKTDAIYL